MVEHDVIQIWSDEAIVKCNGLRVQLLIINLWKILRKVIVLRKVRRQFGSGCLLRHSDLLGKYMHMQVLAAVILFELREGVMTYNTFVYV